MNNEKTPTEMDDDELNQFFNNAIAEKFELPNASKVIEANEVILNFPKDGTYKEKRAYLEKACEDGIIHSFCPLYVEGNNNDDCNFKVWQYYTNEVTIL